MPERDSSATPRRKQTFGGANISHVGPLSEVVPKTLTCVLSFEEALKLHLSLGQALGHLNGYDRSTAAGRRTAVTLSLHPHKGRVFVVEGKLKEKPQTE